MSQPGGGVGESMHETDVLSAARAALSIVAFHPYFPLQTLPLCILLTFFPSYLADRRQRIRGFLVVLAAGVVRTTFGCSPSHGS